ncbi:MAG: SLC13 family permease [Planctomycetaceae bacterium]
MTYTLLVMLIGVTVVVGGILWLRLHAFLALILASFVVAALTPVSALNRFFVGTSGFPVLQQVDEQTFLIETKSSNVEVGDRLVLIGLNPTLNSYGELGRVQIASLEDDETGFPVARLDNQTPLPDIEEVKKLRIVPRDSLKAAIKQSETGIGSRVASGFGNACLKIGIIIAMAGIIGKCLLDSGAADRIVRSTLNMFGEGAAPVAFAASGFLLGVPVFFDTVFFLMIPLGKALHVRTKRSYLLYVLTIVCGATMAHSLVPPTPGPLAVSEELGINLGLMIFAGLIVGLGTAAFGLVYATILNRYCTLPLRESPDVTLADLEETMKRSDESLPSIWLSLSPILVPVVLITGKALLDKSSSPPEWLPISAGLWSSMRQFFAVFGDKNICMTLAALFSMLMLLFQKRPSFAELSTSMQKALSSAGVIILVTAAGGALGLSLRQTGVADLIESLPQSSPVVLCTLAFFLTTAIRTAQGSASVAMMTAAGILSGMVQQGQLDFHPIYLALAIGCGSKPISWMNDSGFLVIARMSGMTEQEALKYVTPMTAAMGLFGLLLTIIGVTLWPSPL